MVEPQKWIKHKKKIFLHQQYNVQSQKDNKDIQLVSVEKQLKVPHQANVFQQNLDLSVQTLYFEGKGK